MDPEQRTHNPLVLGSNPSGPTNNSIEAPVVRKIGATDRYLSIGQLKLFSQLFELAFTVSEVLLERRPMRRPPKLEVSIT
jgi:hypothetical protein